MPWFGELAVWLNKPQGGTATALTHTCCLALRREDFERFNTLMPEFRGSLTKKAKFWKAITGQHLKDGGQHTEAQLLQVRPLRAWKPPCMPACVHGCNPNQLQQPRRSHRHPIYSPAVTRTPSLKATTTPSDAPLLPAAHHHSG